MGGVGPGQDESGGLAGSVRGYLRATFTVGTLSMTRLVTGFVTTKYLAVTAGTAGVGLFAQGNQLYLLGITIGSALVAGVIRKIADAQGHADVAEREAAVMATAFTIQAGASLALLVLAVALAPFLSRTVFGDDGSPIYVVAVALAIPFAVVGHGYIAGIFYGKRRYDLYTRAAVIGAIGSMVAFVLLTWRWGVAGALWSLSAGSVLLFAAYVVSVVKVEPLRRVFARGIDRRISRELLSYGGVIAATTVAATVALLVIRTYIVHEVGEGANGLYQVAIGFTAYYTPFLTNGLWARLFPAVAAEGGHSTANRNELNAALRLVVVGSALCVVGILAFAGLAVRVVYSESFLGAVDLLAIQLPGDVFFFVFFSVGVYLLAHGKLRIYLIGWLVYGVLLVSTSVVFIDRWGVEGAALGYLVTCTIVGLASLVVYLRTVERSEGWSTMGVLAVALVAVAAEALLVRNGAPFLLRLSVPALMLLVAGLRTDRAALRRALGPRRPPAV